MNSIFSILGPVMIGPSSSHTAGAGNIGRAAFMLTDGDIKEVEFVLHGSFAKTGKGHGTDKALIAGILGMMPYDERIKQAYEIAAEKNIKITFSEQDLGLVHPNTVQICVVKSDLSRFELVASSIGGGNISMLSINGVVAQFSCRFPTLIIAHDDKVGMINKITAALAENKTNIVTLQLSRRGKGDLATSVVELDAAVTMQIVRRLEQIENVKSVIYMDRVC